MTKYRTDLKHAIKAADEKEIMRLLNKSNVSLPDYEWIDACQGAARIGCVQAVRKMLTLVSEDRQENALSLSFSAAAGSNQPAILLDLFSMIDAENLSNSLQYACRKGAVAAVDVIASRCEQTALTQALRIFARENNENMAVFEKLYQNSHKKVIKNLLKPAEKNLGSKGRALIQKRVQVDETKRDLTLLLHETVTKKPKTKKSKM